MLTSKEQDQIKNGIKTLKRYLELIEEYQALSLWLWMLAMTEDDMETNNS